MADFETLRDAKNDLVVSHKHFAILFDKMSNPGVATLEDPATGDLEVPATAESAGVIEKQAGVSITHEIESTDIEGYGDAEPVRTIISKRTVQFQANFLETNRVVLEKFWGTYFRAGDNLTVSPHGGVTLKTPTLPKNTFYRCYLVAMDDVDGEEFHPYFIMPRTKLVNVDTQESQDDGAVTYSMTFQAFRDKQLGFSVLQGWCGPGWRLLIDKTGFVEAPNGIEIDPGSLALEVGDDEQLTVMADNGINRTPDATFESSDPSVAEVDADGLVTAVGAGSATITAEWGEFSDTITVTVTSP
ncbi:major tail protein [Mycobacterium phage Kumao]|uniref:Major tail protein n=1 Tax=Mycobacterium phage Kumao TaxID=2041344 RepID=A0A2D1GPU3_9CAUD|nr:major tail protein [Mycobacterium phage Kumao]ATN93985.1 major tail protein [Mycobacterium phage Kumao]